MPMALAVGKDSKRFCILGTGGGRAIPRGLRTPRVPGGMRRQTHQGDCPLSTASSPTGSRKRDGKERALAAATECLLGAEGANSFVT